jgi:L,D-peptidoglycan transpeptidase YkuD (ErfK/YbiS/YcfS/YnhG family)
VTQWGARFGGRSLPCATGRGGIGAKRGEGDGITPAGRHRIEALLWRPDRVRKPRGALPAVPVAPARRLV